MVLFGDVAQPVQLTPTTATLGPGGQVTFAVAVPGQTDQSVTWRPPALGTIAAGVYTAPDTVAGTQSVVLVAVSNADTALIGTALVLLQALAPPIAVAPAVVAVSAGQQVQFTATVQGQPSQAVSWAISPNDPSSGTISAQGVYQAPMTVAAATSIVVSAVVTDGSGATATAEVELTPLATLTLQPATATVYAGQTVQFQALLGGSPTTGLVWTVLPGGVGVAPLGSIDNTGSYTAPASVGSATSVTVLATRVADGIGAVAAVITVERSGG
jgi:plastocyanin